METDLDKGEQLAAFVKKNGSVVILFYNHGEELPANILLGKQKVQTILPARKLVALEINKIKL